MKTYILLATIFVLSTASIQAQVPEFDLSKYARPTISRKSLDLFFNIGGSQGIQPQPSAVGDTINSLIGGDVNLSYQSFQNSPKYQRNTRITLGMQPKRSRRLRNGSDNRSRKLDGNFSINSNILRYNPNQWFIGTELFLSHYASFQNGNRLETGPDQHSNEDYRSAYNNTDLDVTLLAGKGRIELVEDARHGLFILQAIEKDQNLARELTEADIIEFADKIAELKNQRFFDSRLQRIRELEQIHAFLKEKGIVKNQDIAYFAMVQDLWSFGSPSYRFSGNRFSVGINPNISTNHFRSETYKLSTLPSLDTLDIFSKSRSNFSAPSLILSFDHNKPLSESWQESFYVKTEIGLQKPSYRQTRIEDGIETVINSDSADYTPSSYIAAGYSISYYPNTRTSLRGFINSSFSSRTFQGTGSNPSSTLPEISIGNLGLGAEAYYYLSPQTRLSFYYSAQISSTTDQNILSNRNNFLDEFGSNTRFSQNVSISLDFAWF